MIKIRQVVIFALASLLLLNCNTVYQRLAYTNLHLESLICIIAFMLFLSSFSNLNRKIEISFLVDIITIFTLCIVYLLLTNTTSARKLYIMQYLVFLPCMLIYLHLHPSKNAWLDLFSMFSYIVYYTSLISTIIWICITIIPIINTNMTVTIEWGGIKTYQGFAGLAFLAQRDQTFGLTFYRNSGIYTEAPMMSLVLCIALIFQVFFDKQAGNRRIILTSLMIISTLSLTGILSLLLIFMLNLLRQADVNKRKSVFALLSLILLAPFLFEILSELIGMKSETASYSTRLIDYVAGIQSFLANPLHGVGYNNLTPIMTYKIELLAEIGRRYIATGYSNGLIALLAQGGLILTGVSLAPFIVILLKPYDSTIKCWVFCYIFLLALTIFHARFISIYFIVSAYTIVINDSYVVVNSTNFC